jgi:U3 small nucleolar RNA-associated protein 15
MPVLRWLNKYIRDPRFVRLTTDTAVVVLDLYGEEMGKSPQVDAAIQRLHENVRQSVEVAQTSWCTLGMLEALGAGRGTGG